MGAYELELIISYGVIAALLIALFERAILIVPSYILFIGIGSLLVTSIPDLILITIVTTLATTVGSLFWYGLGWWMGPHKTRNLVQRYQRWLFFSVDRYDDLVSKFTSNAWFLVAISQTIPTIRIFVSLPAGVLNMPYKPYLFAIFVGSLVWNGSLIAGGFFLKQTGMSYGLMFVLIVGTILLIEFILFGCRHFSRTRKINRTKRIKA